MTELSETDFLYSVNQTLQTSPNSSQRDFAEASHISLGMTNALLKRFAQKGWIYIKKVNPKNVKYVLTAEGMNELTIRSRNYLSRTFTNIREYSQRIEQCTLQAKAKGIEHIVLYGTSDISFILEYACSKYGMPFVTAKPEETLIEGNNLLLISEQVDEQTAITLKKIGAISLFDLVDNSKENN